MIGAVKNASGEVIISVSTVEEARLLYDVINLGRLDFKVDSQRRNVGTDACNAIEGALL